MHADRHRAWRVSNATQAVNGAAVERRDVSRNLPLHPGHPERVCWGCARYCPADDLACGNGTDRAQHPSEIFGDDWLAHGLDVEVPDMPGLPSLSGR